MGTATIIFYCFGGALFLTQFLRYPLHFFKIKAPKFMRNWRRPKFLRNWHVPAVIKTSRPYLALAAAFSWMANTQPGKLFKFVFSRLGKLFKALRQIVYPPIIVTHAPAPIKYTRAFLNFLLPAAYCFGMMFILAMKGGNGFWEFIQFDDESSKAVFSILPYVFILPYLAIRTVKFLFDIYKILATPMPLPDKIKRLTFKTVNYALIVSCIACAMFLVVATPYIVLANVFFMVMFFQELVDVIHDMYKHKTQRNLPINWDLVFATTFMSLTSVIMISCVLAGVLSIGGPLFNTILFLKTAAYVLAQSTYDAASSKRVPKARLALQFALGLGELATGILLLSGVFALPGGLIGFLITLVTVKIVMKVAAVEYGSYYKNKSEIKTLTSEATNNELITRKKDGQLTDSSTYLKMQYELRYGQNNAEGKVVEEGIENKFWRELHEAKQAKLLPVFLSEDDESQKEGVPVDDDELPNNDVQLEEKDIQLEEEEEAARFEGSNSSQCGALSS